jgi:hypothetical protein
MDGRGPLKTAVLLGAGASRDAGVPMVNEMTPEIYSRISTEPSDGDREAARLRRALGTVIGGLTFQKGIRGEDPYQGLNVEEVFASVQMLANRNDIEAAPFIGSWHSVIDELEEEAASDYEFDRLYRAIRNDIAEELRTIVGRGSSSPLAKVDNEYNRQAGKKSPNYRWGKWIGDALAGVFRQLERGTPSLRARRAFRKRLGGIVKRDADLRRGTIFESLSEAMILSLRDLVWLGRDHDVSYLMPLLELGSERLSINSLNYDNAIELLCQRHNISYSVGITESGAVYFDSEAKVHLIKLHGSIDWVEIDPRDNLSQNLEETSYPLRERGMDNPMGEIPPNLNRPLPLKGLELATTEEMEDREQVLWPAIIFGQGNKLTAEGPYLELLRHFRDDLEEHSTLLVIGYSFRDPHVNHYIAQWFNDEPNRHVIVLNGEGFAQEASPVPLSSGDAPLGGDRPFIQDLVLREGDRVNIVPKTAANGLQQAVIMARNNTI